MLGWGDECLDWVKKRKQYLHSEQDIPAKRNSDGYQKQPLSVPGKQILAALFLCVPKLAK